MKRVLGVDPGLKVTGYAVIEVEGSGSRGFKLLEAGCIEPKKDSDLPQRLDKIYFHLREVIQQYQPQVMVLEKLYAHHRHPATVSVLGHVRGVICLVSVHCQIKLAEYSVKRIRKSLLGQGGVGKQQTREVVARFFKIPAEKLTLDASDAIALGLGYCHMTRGLRGQSL